MIDCTTNECMRQSRAQLMARASRSSAPASPASRRRTRFEVWVGRGRVRKSNDIGGVWALAYPGVRLQNTRAEYHVFSDFPWPRVPDLHPTGAQVRAYLESAVEQLGIDVRRGCEVRSARPDSNGWIIEHGGIDQATQATQTTHATHATQTTHRRRLGQRLSTSTFSLSPQDSTPTRSESRIRRRSRIPRERLRPSVTSERWATWRGNKSASLGTERARWTWRPWQRKAELESTHVFREPRWLIPRAHPGRALRSRSSTASTP